MVKQEVTTIRRVVTISRLNTAPTESMYTLATVTYFFGTFSDLIIPHKVRNTADGIPGPRECPIHDVECAKRLAQAH